MISHNDSRSIRLMLNANYITPSNTGIDHWSAIFYTSRFNLLTLRPLGVSQLCLCNSNSSLYLPFKEGSSISIAPSMPEPFLNFIVSKQCDWWLYSNTDRDMGIPQAFLLLINRYMFLLVPDFITIECQLPVSTACSHGFTSLSNPWGSGSLELSSTFSAALPSTLELTFWNWGIMRYTLYSIPLFVCVCVSSCGTIVKLWFA